MPPYTARSKSRDALLLFYPVIDTFTQLLARLEVRRIFSGQWHRLTCLRIATHARRAVMQGKTAEAADFNAFATRKRLAHMIQHGLDGKLDIPIGEMRLLARQDVNEFRFRHLFLTHHGLYMSAFALAHVLFQNVAERGATGAGATVVLQRLGLFFTVLGLD